MPRTTRKIARPKDVREALEEMSDNHLACYANQHGWILYRQTDLGYRGWERRWFCPRCKMNKLQFITRRGIKSKPKYARPPGYGLSGIGRVQGNGKSVAILEDIRRTAEKDLPSVMWTEE